MMGWSKWLACPDDWPEQKEITPTKKSEKEAKMIKEVTFIAAEKSEEIYQLINKFEFWKSIWITSWIYRFFENCKCKIKLSGPLKTNETEKSKVFKIKHEQGKVKTRQL